MPTKFRRSIWIKRGITVQLVSKDTIYSNSNIIHPKGDFCVVNPIEEGNKVRAEIISILLKDQIRYFKEQNRWPKAFDDDILETRPTEDRKTKGDDSGEEEEADSDSELDDDLVPNTNRVYFESSDEEEDSDEEDEDEEEHRQNEKHNKKKAET